MVTVLKLACVYAVKQCKLGSVRAYYMTFQVNLRAGMARVRRGLGMRVMVGMAGAWRQQLWLNVL
jgi:hypothetical protein